MFDIEVMGNSTFLVYKSDEKNIDSFGLGMLMNNDIEGFLPFTCVQKDENKILNYNITSMIPLGQYMENYLSKEQVINIFKSITKGIISLEEYMLNTHKLLLDKNYIYIDVHGEMCKLLYLPEKSEYSEIGLADFFKNIFMGLRYDSNDNNAYVSDFLNYFSINPQFDCHKFEQWLTDMMLGNEKKAVYTAKGDKRRDGKSGGFEAGVRAGQPQSGAQPLQDSRLAQPPQDGRFAQIPQNNMNENVSAVSLNTAADADKPVKENKYKFFSLGNAKKSNKEQEKADKKQEKADKKQEKQLKKEKKNNKENKEKSSGIMPHFAIPNMNEAPGTPKEPVVPNVSAVPKASLGIKTPVGSKEEINSVKENNFVPVQNNVQNYPYDMAVEMPNANGRGNLDFGDTVMSDDGECETTLLCSSDNRISDANPYLKRIKNGQKRYIDQPVIRIGRMEDYADFYIGDNPFIARTHADIIKENNQCYIRDNNSKNHTYVESRMLLGGEKVRLEHGMKISLANEEFVFYEY